MLRLALSHDDNNCMWEPWPFFVVRAREASASPPAGPESDRAGLQFAANAEICVIEVLSERIWVGRLKTEADADMVEVNDDAAVRRRIPRSQVVGMYRTFRSSAVHLPCSKQLLKRLFAETTMTNRDRFGALHCLAATSPQIEAVISEVLGLVDDIRGGMLRPQPSMGEDEQHRVSKRLRIVSRKNRYFKTAMCKYVRIYKTLIAAAEDERFSTGVRSNLFACLANLLLAPVGALALLPTGLLNIALKTCSDPANDIELRRRSYRIVENVAFSHPRWVLSNHPQCFDLALALATSDEDWFLTETSFAILSSLSSNSENTFDRLDMWPTVLGRALVADEAREVTLRLVINSIDLMGNLAFFIDFQREEQIERISNRVASAVQISRALAHHDLHESCWVLISSMAYENPGAILRNSTLFQLANAECRSPVTQSTSENAFIFIMNLSTAEGGRELLLASREVKETLYLVRKRCLLAAAAAENAATSTTSTMPEDGGDNVAQSSTPQDAERQQLYKSEMNNVCKTAGFLGMNPTVLARGFYDQIEVMCTILAIGCIPRLRRKRNLVRNNLTLLPKELLRALVRMLVRFTSS